MTAEINELSAISVAPGGKLISGPLRFRVVTDETLLPQTVWATPNGDDGYGVLSVKAAGKKKAADDEEDEEEDAPAEEGDDDDWDEEGEEEEDEWDPDFDEFDLPKSTKKGGGKGDEEEEDLKIDEDLNEFDDLFGDGGDDFDDDDDF